MKPLLLYYLLLLFSLLSPLSLRAADHEQLLEMPLDELYALLDKTLASADESLPEGQDTTATLLKGLPTV